MNSSYQRSDNSRTSSSSNYRGSSGFGGGGDFGNRRGASSSGGYGSRDKMSQLDSMSGLKKPNWVNFDLKPFDKMFYTESPIVANKSQVDFNLFYRENNVVVSGSNLVRPVLQFNEINIPKVLLNKMYDARYEKPTSIQAFCWPTLMSGFNMVGIAQTGSGKTLSFILPIIVHIMNNQRYIRSLSREALPGPIALVLAPTRELAIQIQQVAEEFGAPSGVKNVVVYGGASKGPQLSSIRRGADIYIATPGRLLDYLKENLISLSRCTYLVLDEADRMLDMGFEPQIRKIIEQIRPDRQTAMFSATWPKEVRKLAEDFISNYTHIAIGTTNLTANPNIKQIVEVCEENQKEYRLRQILNEIMVHRDSKVIIFAETKKKVDSISKFIKNLGFYCLTIHGDKKQQEREWVLTEFKQKPKSILCATDVAARGLNIEDIKYVINVDYPQATEDYVHRIGRTARNSNSGTSFTFVTRNNSRHLPKLIDVLRETNQYIDESVLSLAGLGGRGRAYNMNSKPYNGIGSGNGSGMAAGVGGGYAASGGSQDYNSRPRKRDISELDEAPNGNGGYRGGSSYNGSKHNDDDAGAKRMRKNRWDDAPPAAASSNGGGYRSSGSSNGYMNGSNGSSGNYQQSSSSGAPYTNDLMSQLSMAPPPPPPMPSGGASQKPMSLMGASKAISPPSSHYPPGQAYQQQAYSSYY